MIDIVKTGLVLDAVKVLEDGEPTGIVHVQAGVVRTRAGEKVAVRFDGYGGALMDVESARILLAGLEDAIAIAAGLKPVEPGALIASVVCPCCAASLRVEHGDEPGEVVTVGERPERVGPRRDDWIEKKGGRSVEPQERCGECDDLVALCECN